MSKVLRSCSSSPKIIALKGSFWYPNWKSLLKSFTSTQIADLLTQINTGAPRKVKHARLLKDDPHKSSPYNFFTLSSKLVMWIDRISSTKLRPRYDVKIPSTLLPFVTFTFISFHAFYFISFCLTFDSISVLFFVSLHVNSLFRHFLSFKKVLLGSRTTFRSKYSAVNIYSCLRSTSFDFQTDINVFDPNKIFYLSLDLWSCHDFASIWIWRSCQIGECLFSFLATN